MRYLLFVCAISAIAISGCARQHSSGSGPAAPSSSAAAASPSPAPLPSGSPAATVTATPEPNLLSWRSGTIVRSYPADTTDPDNVPDDGMDSHDGAGPWSYVFELPGTARLTRVEAKVSTAGENGQSASVSFAGSTTGPDAGFSDIATIASTSSGNVQSANVNATARWVRVTISRKGDARPVSAVGAYGEIAAVPESSKISGTYVQYESPYDKTGKFASAPDRNDPWYLRVVTIGNDGINGEKCFDGHLGDSYPGTRDGRLWTWTANHHTGTFVANDEGSILVGTDGSGSYWVRTGEHPKYCEPQITGKGPANVLVLDSSGSPGLYPATNEADAKTAPHYRFTHIGAAMVDQQILKSASAVVLNGLCNADDIVAPAQDKMIADWVASGHKLLIYDADMCGGAPTHYAMLPYQFQSNNPGARGAKGDRLIQVEDDTLGTSDRNDKAHYFDPKVYASGGNQLGDANTVTTQDSHWCGHLFGTNANHVNGFMQMYSNYGKGVIVYDGLDHDDGDVDSYRRIRLLELDQPIPADLPCTQQASLAFLIEPDRSGNFVPGKAVTLRFPMELLANQGWKGHVTLATSGDFKGSVTPDSFGIAGGTKPLTVAVSVPSNAKPGTYNVVVTGSGNGQTAQAAIQLTAAVPIVKQFQQRRIRIYGIHFDVDKSTIKPQSEPVIAQIAAVMKQNRSWRFRIEGHTDSDGGYAHNMTLSQARAQSVVNDLVSRYKIDRSRLVPAGYGYSRPVASNATAAGKALNRRVELVRL